MIRRNSNTSLSDVMTRQSDQSERNQEIKIIETSRVFPMESSRAENHGHTGEKREQIKSGRNSNFALIKS